MNLLRPIQSLLTGAVLAAIALAQPLSLAAVDRCLSLCTTDQSCELLPATCGKCSAQPVSCCDPISEWEADPSEELRVLCLLQGCALLCPPPADKSEPLSALSSIAAARANPGTPMAFSPAVPAVATGDPPTAFQRANATERRALTCVWTT